jgi:hypothetical protein
LGNNNTASGEYSIALGISDTASGHASTAMGSQNTASGDYSTALGRWARAFHDGTFVWSDSGNSVFDSTGANQFLVNAAGGVGINKNNPATPLEVNGTVTATSFVGNGSGLTGLNIPDGHSLDASDGSPVDALVLDSNGRVGINKASPTSTLDVNGTVKIAVFCRPYDEASGRYAVIRHRYLDQLVRFDRAAKVNKELVVFVPIGQLVVVSIDPVDLHAFTLQRIGLLHQIEAEFALAGRSKSSIDRGRHLDLIGMVGEPNFESIFLDVDAFVFRVVVAYVVVGRLPGVRRRHECQGDKEEEQARHSKRTNHCLKSVLGIFSHDPLIAGNQQD